MNIIQDNLYAVSGHLTVFLMSVSESDKKILKPILSKARHTVVEGSGTQILEKKVLMLI